MNCSYFDLFRNHNGFILTEESGRTKNRLFRKFSRIMRLDSIESIKYRDIYDDDKINQLIKTSYDFNQFFKLPSILIKTNAWFYTADHGRFMMPAPADEIEQRVEDIAAKYPENTIGIHIRRGDHRQAKKMSTNDLFNEIIEREIMLDNSTHFFLSTDSKETEEMILNSYPGLIFVQNNKSFDRSTTENAKDAFVDLLCLSRAKKIYGSYNSSFSGIASSISGSEMIIVEPGMFNRN
ncbi:MAG: hypothetical protein EA359_18970 [Balneolaceae bacterium]|nr:MAG: hypothetical protein EA359_18970 [Balneolaceae bacterium]